MTAFSYIGNTMKGAVENASTAHLKGRVVQVVGTVIKAVLPNAKMGEICVLQNPGELGKMWAEVVGFAKGEVLLAPLSDIHGISVGTVVTSTNTAHRVPVGEQLLGRVLDGMGEPLDTDTKGPLFTDEFYPVHAEPPDPLSRRPISTALGVGVKAIDGLLTCGEGQRTGIFAAAGVGKSSLLAMLARHADVDVTVVALIGERGREVREFIETQLGPEGMAKAVLVVATSDKPVMQRVKAAYVAMAISEYFRDKNKRVLLLMDSITRYARAHREVGLASGEAPTRRGFPPSVFSALPRLLERAGQSERGSITGFYTILVEGDDMNEPVADEMRAILDGHIILSRKLASAEHFPAIDVLESRSRIMEAVASPEHRATAGTIRNLMSKYDEIELLVRMGEYQPGSDPEADKALEKIAEIKSLVTQELTDNFPMSDTLTAMHGLAAYDEVLENSFENT